MNVCCGSITRSVCPWLNGFFLCLGVRLRKIMSLKQRKNLKPRINLNYNMYMGHVISCSKPIDDQLFFNGNLRQRFLLKKKKKPLKICFLEWSERDGRYLTLLYSRGQLQLKFKNWIDITPSFIDLSLFELENSHFMPLIAVVRSNLHDHKNSPAPLSSYSLDFRTVHGPDVIGYGWLAKLLQLDYTWLDKWAE